MPVCGIAKPAGLSNQPIVSDRAKPLDVFEKLAGPFRA